MKNKFNYKIQEVGGRLPCWREDTYERNRKAEEKEHPKSEGLAQRSNYDSNWAKKKKQCATQEKILNEKQQDKIFPRKRKSDLFMMY